MQSKQNKRERKKRNGTEIIEIENRNSIEKTNKKPKS